MGPRITQGRNRTQIRFRALTAHNVGAGGMPSLLLLNPPETGASC